MTEKFVFTRGFSLLIAALTLHISAMAQSFLDFMPQGNEVIWLYDLTNNSSVNGTLQYRYSSEDEMIDGLTYRKVFHSYRIVITPGMGGVQVQEGYDQFSSYMRQDENGVIYVRYASTEPERTLFDPNITDGETLPESWVLADPASHTWYADPITVSLVNYMYDNDNGPHLVHHFDTPDFLNREFIEGIGSTYGFYSLLPSVQGAPLSYIRCVLVDGELHFPFSGGIECSPLVSPNSIEEVDGEADLTIYPNPTQDMVTVSGNKTYRLRLTNAVGQTVAETNGNSLSLAHLPHGLYLLLVNDQTGTPQGVARVIKNL